MNWKLRLQNGWFLAGLISLILLIVGYICTQLGWKFDVPGLGVLLNGILAALVTMGIVTNPTDPGAGDSVTTLAKTNITQTAQDVINIQLKQASLKAEEAMAGTTITTNETAESEVE